MAAKTFIFSNKSEDDEPKSSAGGVRPRKVAHCEPSSSQLETAPSSEGSSSTTNIRVLYRSVGSPSEKKTVVRGVLEILGKYEAFDSRVETS